MLLTTGTDRTQSVYYSGQLHLHPSDSDRASGAPEGYQKDRCTRDSRGSASFFRLPLIIDRYVLFFGFLRGLGGSERAVPALPL